MSSVVSPAAEHEPEHERGSPLLAVNDLTVAFPTRRGPLYAVHGVSFTVEVGQTVGLVGESGSGKSVMLRTLIGLLPVSARVVDGSVSWQGRDLLRLRARQLQRLRGSEIGMVFQDPMTALNPVFSVGSQLRELLRVKGGLSRTAAQRKAVELLGRVGIRDPRARLDDYPHQFSGGMRQRVLIALAIALDPRLLLADEPTTALDVTIQDQILALLADIQAETGMAMLFVSHDLGVIAQICDSVAVMYAGRILEAGPGASVLDTPRHPYTRGLLRALPKVSDRRRYRRLQPIPGQPPDLAALAAGCPFVPRCGFAQPACGEIPVRLDQPWGRHGSACPFPAASVGDTR